MKSSGAVTQTPDNGAEILSRNSPIKRKLNDITVATLNHFLRLEGKEAHRRPKSNILIVHTNRGE